MMQADCPIMTKHIENIKEAAEKYDVDMVVGETVPGAENFKMCHLMFNSYNDLLIVGFSAGMNSIAEELKNKK